MSYPRGFGTERADSGWPGRTEAGLLAFEESRDQDFVSRQQAWTPKDAPYAASITRAWLATMRS